MPQKRTHISSDPRGDKAPRKNVDAVLRTLKRLGTEANVAGMARYGIQSPKALGVSLADLRGVAKELGQNHALALELWETGWHEARMLSSFIADPNEITASQMDRWVRDFDNWAITDTVCFSLFDRTRHAWTKIDEWSRRRAEFERRAAFALLASMALHDKSGPDAEYRKRLPLVKKCASDERNFVKKGVSWALHGIGCRSTSLNVPAIEVAEELAHSSDRTERWVGKDALRKLRSGPTAKRVARGDSARASKPSKRQAKGRAS
jgi:3-methyladenine DNA glycosylase AlkD